MINLKIIFTFCLVFVVFFLISARSEEIIHFKNSGNEIAIEKIEESLTFIEKSNQEKLSGNSLKSEVYIKISEIKLKTAESLLRSHIIKAKIAESENNLASIKSKNTKLKEEFRENIAQLKQFNDQITLSKELIYNNSLDNLESALSHINDAEQVDSTIYSSSFLNEAYIHYQKAMDNHKTGNYEESVIDSEQSVEFSKKAFRESSNKYKEKESLSNNLSNIFGFVLDNINNSITLSSQEIFSPQSSSIRFDLYPSLDKIVDIIINYQDLKIEVKAYNNSFTNSKKNLDLSYEQSKTIKSYLVSKGINKEAFIEKKYMTKDIANQRKIEIILNI